MAGFCGKCGEAILPGNGFCGRCGAPAAGGGQVPVAKGSALPWIIALTAVLLLGVAGGYLLMLRQQQPDQGPPPAANAAPATTAAPAAPAPPAPPPPASPPVASTVSSGGNAGADRLIATYTAYIGRDDLYASDGVRLTQPWQILRQDRANVHRFGISQPGDSGDSFFSSAGNRATMERMVMQGRISPAAARAIVSGGSMVEVSIYGSGTTGRYLDIRVN